MTRARSGDREALEALARWCYPRVYRWALMRAGDHDEAEDVTQDVMATLQRRLRGYEGRAQFGTWLFRVTANVAGNRRRLWQRRRTLLTQRSETAPTADEEARQIGLLQDEFVNDLVRTLLSELPGQQRMVFDLADLQGLDAAEIATMLALEPATVRSHLMRARRAIRSRIIARAPTLAEDRT